MLSPTPAEIKKSVARSDAASAPDTTHRCGAGCACVAATVPDAS